MNRFFAGQSDIMGNIVTIRGDDVKHIRKVLRLSPGDGLIICDGLGTDYKTVIIESSADYIKAEIKSEYANKNEPPIKISLYQALPKLDKLDYIIQKCVEIGVYEIFPIESSRSVSKVNSAADAEKKRERWQKIAMEAAKQSGRGIIPTVHAPMSLNEAVVGSSGFDMKLIPYESEDIANGIRSVIPAGEVGRIMVVIGPEGGFDAIEIEKAVENGILPVRFGPRILRTETAGIAVISILMHIYGDM